MKDKETISKHIKITPLMKKLTPQLIKQLSNTSKNEQKRKENKSSSNINLKIVSPLENNKNHVMNSFSNTTKIIKPSPNREDQKKRNFLVEYERNLSESKISLVNEIKNLGFIKEKKIFMNVKGIGCKETGLVKDNKTSKAVNSGDFFSKYDKKEKEKEYKISPINDNTTNINSRVSNVSYISGLSRNPPLSSLTHITNITEGSKKTKPELTMNMILNKESNNLKERKPIKLNDIKDIISNKLRLSTYMKNKKNLEQTEKIHENNVNLSYKTECKVHDERNKNNSRDINKYIDNIKKVNQRIGKINDNPNNNASASEKILNEVRLIEKEMNVVLKKGEEGSVISRESLFNKSMSKSNSMSKSRKSLKLREDRSSQDKYNENTIYSLSDDSNQNSKEGSIVIDESKTKTYKLIYKYTYIDNSIDEFNKFYQDLNKKLSHFK